MFQLTLRICAHVPPQAEEYRKTAEEERRGLETEKEELHKQLQVSTLKVRIRKKKITRKLKRYS